jgi:hypothetical protein
MAVTSVASTTDATQLLASDGGRGGLIITNTDANALYVLFDSGSASSTNFSVELAEDESFGLSGYTGPVGGVWAGNGSGAALVTTWGR